VVRIIPTLPRDVTLLSSVLYEGVLFTAQFLPVKFDGTSIELPDNFPAVILKNYLQDERVSRLKIMMAGNDTMNTIIFRAYGIEDQSRKSYYDLIFKLKSYANRLRITKRVIWLGIKLENKNMIIDEKEMINVNGKKRALAAPQLFKVDRYTGISSLESGYTSKQITIYTSKEILLLFLFGLYSSFVTSLRQRDRQYYFFLMFSPEEIESMLNRLEDKEFIRRLFRTKEKVIEFLSAALNKTAVKEAILLEVYLNVELKKLIEKENLEKISMILFKIAPEGGQPLPRSYKVYELIPVTIYRGVEFHKTIGRYIKDPETFLEKLSEKLKPEGTIFNALRNIDRFSEGSNILRAVHELYRFVVLGHVEGWYAFLREIANAYRKLENSTQPQEQKRSLRYKRILETFAYK